MKIVPIDTFTSIFEDPSNGSKATTYVPSSSLRITSGFLTSIFFALLVYSVLIEVNLNKKKADKLITSGTYALTRHPGVLWLLFYYIFGALLFANIELLIAGIVWSIANIFYVYLQEKLVFHKIFNNYDLYAITTPMLLPNIKSAKKCIKTLTGG